MYKVVTNNLRSLGLRKNPNTMNFKLNEWKHEPTPMKGSTDNGGIWCCEKLSSAKTLKKYFEKRYGTARVFECEVGNILFQNSYRTKTSKIKLIKEIIIMNEYEIQFTRTITSTPEVIVMCGDSPTHAQNKLYGLLPTVFITRTKKL